MRTIAELPINPTTVEIVMNLFEVFRSHERVATWLKTRHYIFGNVSPAQLIFFGRAQTILEFTRRAARDAKEPEVDR